MSEEETDVNERGNCEVMNGTTRYRKAPYRAPAEGVLYIVRDKSGSERVVQVKGTSDDGVMVELVTVEQGRPLEKIVRVPMDSLARQAAKGWCRLLVFIPESTTSKESENGSQSGGGPEIAMRIDSENFGRCCADIARANIRFSTQLIKDVGDGPFRAGDYEQAFLTFEQLSVGFNSAVGNRRREIAEGRRKLTAEKGKLSGKEIQERTAGFMRSEQLIHTAEREFATILEGLRMYLRAQQNRSAPD